MKFHYICTECGHEFAITPDLMLCPECAKMQESDKPIRGILIIETEGELPADWDIFDLLPVEREYFPDIPVGNTPLWAPRRLREELGYPNLYLKDDTREPTFSFKDRASFLVAAFAGAALDVFEEEPPSHSPLLELDNVVLTPHTAAFTFEGMHNMSAGVVEQLIAYCQGNRPAHLVNPEVWDKR